MNTRQIQATGVQAKSGKYLTFRLAGEEYGLEILKVREIIGMMTVTKVPRTPEFVRGVINLRGAVIPVIDLRCKFGLAQVIDTPETCIIVVEILKHGEAALIGIIVDAVSEVMDISAADIESTPSFGAELDTSYILGMAKSQGVIKILLNIEKVLTEKEITDIKAVKNSIIEIAEKIQPVTK